MRQNHTMSTVELRNIVHDIVNEADIDFLRRILAMKEANQQDVPEFHKEIVRERIIKYGNDFSKYNDLEDLENKINLD